MIGLKADRKTQALVARLADKCNEGRLTVRERAEYESYVRAIDLIAILQRILGGDIFAIDSNSE